MVRKKKVGNTKKANISDSMLLFICGLVFVVGGLFSSGKLQIVAMVIGLMLILVSNIILAKERRLNVPGGW